MEESAIFEKDDDFKFKKKRKKNWTDPTEMEAFLNLLEENIKELSLLKRNLTLYHKMSYKMANLGFHREPYELRKKLSNIFSKYKNEKSQQTSEWPYLDRVHEIVTRMKKLNPSRFAVPEKQENTEESMPIKSKHEIQKLLVITPGSNVCIDEADMETILKAMNGEDISSRNDETSASVEIIDSANRTPDSIEIAEVENDDSMSNDMTSETSNQSAQKTATPRRASENHEMSDECTPLTHGTKRKNDDPELHPRKEKAIAMTKEPIIIKECVNKAETGHSEKDEVDLYAALLATKLKSMDDKSRHIAMNKIDNILFEMKMKQFES